jgi:hypothetical protein
MNSLTDCWYQIVTAIKPLNSPLSDKPRYLRRYLNAQPTLASERVIRCARATWAQKSPPDARSAPKQGLHDPTDSEFQCRWILTKAAVVPSYHSFAFLKSHSPTVRGVKSG